METLRINELTERYTAAMVEAVLGQKLWSGAVTLRTPDQLSQYLMLDTQNSAQLQATRISSTVRCLQQHIQSVYSGMEKGYESSHFDDEDLQYWYGILSHYDTWSANVLLKDQAENYIVPGLRLKKTALFRALEGNLNQMRLGTESVQRGLMEYTQAFQRLCDLDVLSGYIDGDNVQDARYYLVGQERTAPFAYHLRSVKVELDNDSKKINPAAWGEWQKVDIATADTVIDIRCVSWLGLPAMVWCEWRERQLDSDGRVLSPWSLEIKLAFSSLSGQWSAPLSLHQRDCEHDVSNGRLTVVSLGDGDPRDDRLAVCYTNRHGLDGPASYYEIEILETRDALFRKIPDDTATLLAMTYGRFASATSLQQKVVPADYSTVTIEDTIEIPGSIAANLHLDAIYTRERAADNNFYEVLRVRGRCDAVKESGRVIERLSIRWRAEANGKPFDVDLVDAGERQLRITLTTREKPGQAQAVELAAGEKGEKEILHTFAVDDFEETSVGDGIWVASAVATLSDTQLSFLLVRTPDEILAGAGFSVSGLGDALENEQNRLVPRIFYAPVVFWLEMPARTIDDPQPWFSTGVLDGQYATPWRAYRRQTPSLGINNFPIDVPIDFIFGESDQAELRDNSPYGRKKFAVTLKDRPRLYVTPSIDKSSVEGAQFLSHNNDRQALRYSRVNSTFGPVLTSRATVSVDALMSWDTQHVDEPAMPDGNLEENGPFDGCNGLYFWELFFHTPDLVGSRLSAEGRHREAQGWYEYIFNPLARTQEADDGDPPVIPAPAYWRCRPLQNENIDSSHEVAAPTDPDAIGYGAPVHFKIAVFLRYVENLIAWGDAQYRQLNYDSMVQAGLNYTRALSLFGEEPVTRTASTWLPKTLSELLVMIREREPLKVFEEGLALSLASVPSAMQATPRFDLLGSGVFRPGINERPKALWNLLTTRLDNLRNNRSIDGQPLSIPLFSQTMDPLELLRSQADGRSGSTRSPGGQVQVVPYKWQTVQNLALQGVEFLIQQEDQLRSWLELRDRGELEELQQSHMIELADHARSIQQATIAQLEATSASLRQSESMVKARAQHYERLILEGVSEAEYGVLEKNRTARYLAAGAGALRATGSALDVVPNIFGLANGGMRPAAVPYALADVAQLTADLMMREAEEASIIEQQRRRRQEWELVRDQSDAELRVLHEQLRAQEHAIGAARAALAQTDAANVQARAVYAFYKNRTTGRELSNWVVGQVKTLIYQVYDVVTGLCLCAETCWRYEMADYTSRFIRPDVWVDACHGFTSGQSLKLDLLRMAAARIKRDEHRLQLVKTISLKGLDPDRWKAFMESGKLEISLNERVFNEDYPGHYCRQVKSVSLTFPALLGPYQNICATLVQTSSSTLLAPDIQAVEYLHDPSTGHAPPGSLVQNLRPYQQIGLSLGLDDDGLAGGMDDGRYRPFEGTGAHAQYVLTLPRADKPEQASMLESLTDIILTLVYQARDGGPAFAGEVERLLETNPSTIDATAAQGR